MAPKRRVFSETTGAAQAPVDSDNIKTRRVPPLAAASSRRKRVSDEAEEVKSQVDRAKVKRRRVAGRLADLMEMPMDILFEIFGHLMPIDVLRLARTTKQFRQLLMHRSSVSIWIAARKNVVGLPECPPCMSEPQFANLVFDTHCHECLSPHTRSVDWRIGRRICSKCAKVCMMEDYPVFSGESVYKAVPSKYGKKGRPSYYSKDLKEFQAKRESFTDPQERDKFIKERQTFVIQMEKHGALLEAWAANQANHRSEQLEDLRRERKQAIIEKLTELGWGPEIEQIPYRDDLSHHKLVKQPIRLTTRIWTNMQDEMISYMERMKTQRLERERKALVISRKRIAISVLRSYKLSHLPLSDIMPEPMDFCAIPQVSEILELPTETQVSEDTFTPIVEEMDELVSEWRTRILRLLVEKVKESLSSTANRVSNTDTPPDLKGKGKAKVIEPSIPDDSQIIQDLALATSVFNCKTCNPPNEDDIFDSLGFGFSPRYSRSRSNPLFFPKVLGHRCLTKQRGFNWDSHSGDPTKQYDYPMGNRTRWTCNLLSVDDVAGKMAANVVSACGLDPKTATAIEMDQLDHQLACLTCLEWSDEEWDQAEAPVFGWRAAVTHNCRYHPSRTNIEWKLIDDELAPDVVDVDEEYRGSNRSIFSVLALQSIVPDDMYVNPPEDAVWLCAHCMDLPTELGDCLELNKMKTHLSGAHVISDPEENRDYYRDYEAPQGPKARTPHLKISLTMDRPDNVPPPGERNTTNLRPDPWCFNHSDDEFEDEYYDDYDLFLW